LVAGNGARAEDRVLTHGDGWLPQLGPFVSVDELRTRIDRFRRRARDCGRGPLPVTVFGVPDDYELLARLADLGVGGALVPVRSENPAEVFTSLDALAATRERLAVSRPGPSRR